MIVVLIGGFAYDILGRKKTLLISFFVSGAAVIVMPYTAPHVYSGLLIVRIIFAFAI